MKKIALVTVACNDTYYYQCAVNLTHHFASDDDYDVIIFTDNVSIFKSMERPEQTEKIKYINVDFTSEFSYHSKFNLIDRVRQMGYSKICFIDADMFLSDESFVKSLKEHEFNPGFSYSRYTASDLKNTIENNPKFQKFMDYLNKNELYYSNAVVPWEDIVFFNFEGIQPYKINDLFQYYTAFRTERELVARTTSDDLKGEGLIFSLAALHAEFPVHSSKFLFNQLKCFRDNHHPKYVHLDSITKGVYFIILKSNGSESQDEMAQITANFYRERFPQSVVKIVQDIKEVESELSEVCVIIDNGTILLNSMHLQRQIEEVIRGFSDYVIPYTTRYVLPKFTFGDKSSGMYITRKSIITNTINRPYSNKTTWGEILSLNESDPVIKQKLM